MINRKLLNQIPFHIMLFPSVVLLLIFSYYPMLGILMAFEDYRLSKGFFKSPWIGLENFEYMFSLPDTFQVFWNTLFIAVLKIIAGILVPVIFALLLNELGRQAFKRGVQAIIYLPYFLSWVVLAGIAKDILSPSEGIINIMLNSVGIEPIFFLGDPKWFPFSMVLTDTWKNFGFGTIVYMAALTSIDPTYYEAAIVDGANRWRQLIHITLPSIMPVVVLMTVLSLGNILNAGFDQVFNLYSPSVYSTGDIIDTLVYRLGMLQSLYGVSAAVGLMKSVISFMLITISYKMADTYAGYRVF
jgi:putative aldouronate transport system permease protein